MNPDSQAADYTKKKNPQRPSAAEGHIRYEVFHAPTDGKRGEPSIEAL